MKPRNMIESLSEVDGPSTWTLFGDVSLRVNTQDAQAARILQFIEAEWPGATVGEVIEMLDAASWWSTFFTSLAERKEPTP